MVGRPTVCIAGMHRSGTSLTAHWLQRCGLPVDLGHRDGPQVGNRDGEFEDVDLRRLHVRSIRRAHPDAAGWRVTDPSPLRFGPVERAALRRELWRRDRAHPVWGFKDPRACLFLDEWARRRRRLVTLVVWRPRDEVVDSLLRRASRTDLPVMQVSREEAGAVWDAYCTRLVAHAEAHPRATVVVALRDLLSQDREVFDLLGERTGWSLRHVPIGDLFRPEELGSSVSRPAPSTAGEEGAIERRLRQLGRPLSAG